MPFNIVFFEASKLVSTKTLRLSTITTVKGFESCDSNPVLLFLGVSVSLMFFFVFLPVDFLGVLGVFCLPFLRKLLRNIRNSQAINFLLCNVMRYIKIILRN